MNSLSRADRRVPRIVQIVAASTAADLEARTMVERASRAAGVRVRLKPTPWTPAAAIVLILEPTHDAEFAAAVARAIARLERHGALRVFVALRGCDRAAFDALAAAGDSLCQTVLDSIHLSDTMTVAEAESALTRHLAHWIDERDAARWRKIRRWFATAAGLLATGVECLAFPVVAAIWLAIYLHHPLPYSQQVGSFACGMAMAPLATWALYFVLRGPRLMATLHTIDAGIRARLMAGLVLCLVLGYAMKSIGVANAWMYLGTAYGIGFDALRRAGLRMRQSSFRPGGLHSMQSGKTTLLEHFHALTCPLWPPANHSVVISYARASKWGRQTAAALHEALKNRRVFSYLDRENIPIGESWKRHLRNAISRATVFVSLADKRATERPVVVDEVQAALRAHDLTGCPHLTFVQGSDLETPAAPALFRSAFEQGRMPLSAIGSLRAVAADHFVIDAFVSLLRPILFRPNSVVPRSLAYRLDRILSLATILAAWSGTLGLLGWVACWIELRHGMWIRHAAGDVGSGVLFLLAAIQFGGCLRLALEANFRVDVPFPGLLLAQLLVAALGLLAFMTLWFDTMGLLAQLWAPVALAFGWWRVQTILWQSVLGGNQMVRNID